MNPNIPNIDQLKELGLPALISYVPQTWGWWGVLAVLMVAVIAICAHQILQWRRNRYRREALEKLAQLRTHNEEMSSLCELPELLKRVALSMPAPKSHRQNVQRLSAHLLAVSGSRPIASSSDLSASLQSRVLQNPASLGKADWQAFLQHKCKKPLPADFSKQLAQLAYAPDAALRDLPTAERLAMFDICQYWVEHHHVAA